MKKNNFLSCTIVDVTDKTYEIRGFGFIDYFLRQLKINKATFLLKLLLSKFSFREFIF